MKSLSGEKNGMVKRLVQTGSSLIFLGLASSVLACTYEEGNHYYEMKQYDKAYACFMQPDNLKNPKAQNTLGIMYRHGFGVEKDDKKAVEWYTRAAMNGNADAQFNLGLSYEKGRGIKKDDAKALEWYLKAAEQQYAPAELNIGYLYDEGMSIWHRDRQKALYWYRRAARHGDTDAMTNLGHAYYLGTGVQKNLNHAIQYYLMAAEKGHAKAQYLAGDACEKGHGIERDCERALFWYKKAAENGEIMAMDRLSRIYGTGLCGQAENHEESMKWLKKSGAIKRDILKNSSGKK